MIVLIISYIICFALYANATISQDVYGYDNFFISSLTMVNLLTRGSMFYTFRLNSYTETVEFTYQVIGEFKLLIFIIFFHIIVKYVGVNISIAAFLKEYDNTRFEKIKAVKYPEDEK